MLTIKDFTKEEKAYRVIDDYVTRKINEVTVKAVGRKYVTAADGYWEFKFEDHDCEYLLEVVNCGSRSILFKTKQDAEDYVEKREISMWLACKNSSFYESLSIDQLRQIKAILEHND